MTHIEHLLLRIKPSIKVLEETKGLSHNISRKTKILLRELAEHEVIELPKGYTLISVEAVLRLIEIVDDKDKAFFKSVIEYIQTNKKKAIVFKG